MSGEAGGHFLDFRFDSINLDRMMAILLDRPATRAFAYLVTPNVDHIVRMARERDLPDAGRIRDAYLNADWCLCDSRILALLAKRKGIKLNVVPGSDLTAVLLDRLGAGDTICVVGGDVEMLRVLSNRYPGIAIKHHVPPMGMRRNGTAIDMAAAFVAEAGARFTFLAVGSPQQELLARRIAERGDATGIGLCVGASMDFVTGRAQRAPRWMQRMHLEWAHRLVTNPRRLWRRYLVEGPRIFKMARDWKPEGERR